MFFKRKRLSPEQQQVIDERNEKLKKAGYDIAEKSGFADRLRMLNETAQQNPKPTIIVIMGLMLLLLLFSLVSSLFPVNTDTEMQKERQRMRLMGDIHSGLSDVVNTVDEELHEAQALYQELDSVLRKGVPPTHEDSVYYGNKILRLQQLIEKYNKNVKYEE